MQYSKPMIDLVYEIRRRVDGELKPGIKLANPDMLQELADLYHRCKDTITRLLIKELLTLAGEVWLAQIDTQIKKVSAPGPAKKVSKIYRGHINLTDAPTQPTAPPATTTKLPDTPKKQVRIYRGQVID
jgi:hypothetical protein